MTIYKYALKVEDFVSMLMPPGAKVLCVQTQRGAPHIWALVDPARADLSILEERRFRIYGTGHKLESPVGHYIGTFQIAGGDLAFHVFEEEKR